MSELRGIMKAAEQAAASNNYEAAERLLREAVELQEQGFGPTHSDLANTLNNLGVVCERLEKPDEAERCYRRAYSIATSALPPNHPFVETSRKNLEDFCSARGRPIEPPAAAAAREPDPESPSRGLPMRAVVAAIALVIAIVGWIAWPSSHAPEPVTEPHVAAAPVQPTPAPEPARPAPAPPAPVNAAREPGAAPAVADARLCRALTTKGEWRCEPIADPVTPGPIYFYTRVASSSDTIVQHRWYFRERLHQDVMLNIKANGDGYRTFSRTTINSERSGEWRVELLAQDGQVLHEERFTVR